MMLSLDRWQMLSKCSNIYPTILGRIFFAIALAMAKTRWNIKTSRYSTTMFLSNNVKHHWRVYIYIYEDCRQNDATFIPPFFNRLSSSCLKITIQETNGWTMLETKLCHLKTHVKGSSFFTLPGIKLGNLSSHYVARAWGGGNGEESGPQMSWPFGSFKKQCY